VIASLHRELVDPRTYGRIAYLLVAGVLGICEFIFLVTGISVGVGLAVTLIGIPILVGCVYVWGWLADLERRTIGALTGTVIASPYRPLPEGGWWERLRARLADPATWKDLAFLFLQLPFGLVGFVVTVAVLAIGLQCLTVPLWYWAPSDTADLFGFFTVDTLPEALACVPFGACVLLVGIPALSKLGRLYTVYAELLLGSNEDPALTAQVSDLRDARARIIEAADAERRRIERDLHDGAQQRLVALSLSLRMAEKRAAAGDPGAAELVRSANEEASLALKELRDLARGIHPAILTNRGLAAALDDLASRAPVPVELVAMPGERLSDQVESAAYFLVSECLANVGKHAKATRATVAVTVVGEELEVIVKDDGVGGAELGNGSGLQGLEDRVGALDGCVDIESPPGGGTTVMATIPLAGPAAEATGPALSEEQVLALAERRRRGLRYRLIALGTISFVIVAIWALTGAPNAWPVWPLLSLAFVAALDAWRVHAPHSRSARGRLLGTAGTLAITNLFLIGIWLASGSDYFWPAWVMLGSAVALALKAIPWAHASHGRMHGASYES
jgi:signal transduction histidine kinase